MRNLASIQRISSIEPIEGADKIELAYILGWHCVVNKNVFKEGDLCVYYEIDSFLPIKEEYEFLRSSSYRNNDFIGEGFKIKTMKFRGQISQGLALPIPDGITGEVGTDLTEKLGVKKWEIPEQVSNNGIIIGDRPEFIIKTDETRIQSCPELLEEFRGLE